MPVLDDVVHAAEELEMSELLIACLLFFIHLIIFVSFRCPLQSICVASNMCKFELVGIVQYGTEEGIWYRPSLLCFWAQPNKMWQAGTLQGSWVSNEQLKM